MASQDKKTETTAVQKRETTDVAKPERTRSRVTFSPAVDIHENSDGLVLLADMPGVDEKNVQVDLDSDVLTISGHVPDEDHGDRQLAYSEYEVGDYYREFSLSDVVDTERIEARIKDGVLCIWLPKAEEKKQKKIPVKSA